MTLLIRGRNSKLRTILQSQVPAGDFLDGYVADGADQKIRAGHNVEPSCLTTWLACGHRHSKPNESKNAILIDFHDRVEELFDEVPWNDPAVSIEEIVENRETMN